VDEVMGVRRVRHLVEVIRDLTPEVEEE